MPSHNVSNIIIYHLYNVSKSSLFSSITGYWCDGGGERPANQTCGEAQEEGKADCS